MHCSVLAARRVGPGAAIDTGTHHRDCAVNFAYFLREVYVAISDHFPYRGEVRRTPGEAPSTCERHSRHPCRHWVPPMRPSGRKAEPEHLETRVWGVSGPVRNQEQNRTEQNHPCSMRRTMRPRHKMKIDSRTSPSFSNHKDRGAAPRSLAGR